MKLLITGLSHHTAPVEVREKLAFEEQALPGALDRLCRRPGMVEGMILSTCNRVEVAVTAEESSDAANSVDEFLAEARSVEPSWVSPYLYHYNGPDAIRHLFRVASSLDSMIVGEPQILGQLK
ncbi:MAG TPA: glutamyl-tRNA reductase, partial [Candidatus Angelobacter sp.]|nr:glutamyl-tRNA reductase [Candidatus Angelobacter sp.]